MKQRPPALMEGDDAEDAGTGPGLNIRGIGLDGIQENGKAERERPKTSPVRGPGTSAEDLEAERLRIKEAQREALVRAGRERAEREEEDGLRAEKARLESERAAAAAENETASPIESIPYDKTVPAPPIHSRSDSRSESRMKMRRTESHQSSGSRASNKDKIERIEKTLSRQGTSLNW
jgi:hypothetical protein